ncbi:zf-C2HC5-domain-containing protein [Xylariaceae sp. FL0594]|nr:zf-C2HC5-domain-containing protein [Xylariaceae sp. FL0594]
MSLLQLSRLLPLPDNELKQVLEYAATLSKVEAAEHFGNLLGDSPQAVDFIASFNSRRRDPKLVNSGATTAASAGHAARGTNPDSAIEPVPKPNRGHVKKKKANIHALPPRSVLDSGPPPGTTYNKKHRDEDYLGQRPSSANHSENRTEKSGDKSVIHNSATPPPQPRSGPSAGRLISELPPQKPKSTPASRSSTPAPKTKVNITGGTAMHGASTALKDLDDAIRALEMTTNPSKTADASTRRCDCVAARHPPLAAAPNCLNCGKVICLKEGLGPCTFCGTPLLSSSEVQSMLRELKDERGREKMAIDRQSHKRPEVSQIPAPFSKSRETQGAKSEAEAKALEHRDRLLAFQAQNARRTTIRDEAADFDVSAAVSGSGGSIWATPEERAREFKRQQKILREMEWNARPEYEKRRQVISIDVVGGKVVRKMASVQRPQSPDDEQHDLPMPTERGLKETDGNRSRGSGGAFGKNPLLGNLIKPVFDPKGKGLAQEGRSSSATKWRRVQDDLDDNEGLILDGGAYGRADEPPCG